MFAIGRPIVTGPPASRRAHVAYVVTSDGPYRSFTRSIPGSAYTAVTSSALSGSPARFTVRTPAGTSPLRSSSAITDGTVLIKVTRSAAGSVPTASACSASTTVPPAASGPNNSNTDRSKHTDVAANTPAHSSAVNTSRAHCRNATAFPCVIATPFGTPVDPDV